MIKVVVKNAPPTESGRKGRIKSSFVNFTPGGILSAALPSAKSKYVEIHLEDTVFEATSKTNSHSLNAGRPTIALTEISSPRPNASVRGFPLLLVYRVI